MNFRKIIFICFFGLILFTPLRYGHAAVLSLSPSSGTFTVGSVFSVSLFLDTKDKSVNVIEASLSFPPDKLQLVSPATGQSIISIWTSQPRFNNADGRVDLQGGMPGGINVSNGLIATLNFRVKSVGSGILKFLDNSKVLLNDGLGTNALEQIQSGVYNFILPPPAGPIVASETHPDQSRWYSNSTVILRWAPNENVEGYSYMLSENPIDVPDDISEGNKTSVIYKNTGDGVKYFHIKALREGGWGGITHFAVNIDTTPPAEFPIQISPDSRTTRRIPVIQFLTSDLSSGIDHYELKIVPLTPNAEKATGNQPLFIEAESPYVTPQLDLGNYDVIVRAYDKAGNYREETQRLEIVTALFQFIKNQGLQVKTWFVIPWLWVWLIAILLIGILSFAAFVARRWHYIRDLKLKNKNLPSHIQERLKELKAYRQKYGNILMILLILSASLLFAKATRAEDINVASPLITTISRNISNEEIFYVGGKVNMAKASVIIYLQNLQTGETMSETAEADQKGDWFYRHSTFLSTGNYIIWAQAKLGDEMSPPSPQIQMMVSQTAIQFGTSRVSYETLYLIMSIIFLLAIIILTLYIIFHAIQGRKKYKQFWREIKEAEESVQRGFSVLRRDIEAELNVIGKAKLSREISTEEKEKEKQLLKDLDSIQKYISKEVWDIEKMESPK